MSACCASLVLACGWSSPAAADDRAPLTVIQTDDLAAQLPAIDARLQQAASVEQERDELRVKVSILEQLLALKDEVIAAKAATIAAKAEQIDAEQAIIADLREERKLYQERLDTLQAQADRAGFMGDLKAVFVGIVAALLSVL